MPLNIGGEDNLGHSRSSPARIHEGVFRIVMAPNHPAPMCYSRRVRGESRAGHTCSIIHQNECVGAIGVSGVQSQDDEKVANAGIAALS
jgi:hypothetical protein